MSRLLGVMLVLATVSVAQASIVAAPEIDPGAAMSALTLLAGGLAVVRGRRNKK